MLKIFEPINVLYMCTCGAERPITKVYFCRHCSKLRCSGCVSHEVDSHYCRSCLEYMPSQEARVKKNKCTNCFQCPCCWSTLATKSVSVPIPKDDVKSPPQKGNDIPTKKMYFLSCAYCRWNSKEAGIPLQTTSSGGWQEEENPHSKRVSQLMEFYRVLAQKEKLEKEKKSIRPRYTYIHIPDKYGMSKSVVRKLQGLPQAVTKTEFDPALQLEIPTATSDVEPLPESFLAEPLNLPTITTLSQRLAQPIFQPVLSKDLHIQSKYMNIRRSQRCKECEHNLCKTEYNPSSIKFKIQMAAFYHIPQLRVKQVSKLYLNKLCRVEMVLINPTAHLSHVTFEPVEDLSDEFSAVKLPPGELVLSPKDDTAEFDDVVSENQGFKDDPNIITFRKSNKIGFMFSFIPSTRDVKVSFKLRHDFVNMFVTLPNEPPRQPQVVWLTHVVKIALGTVVGEGGQQS